MLVLIAILGLGLLIFVHELGHYLAARACGMYVEKFYLGFPPAILKTRRGGTEYGIGAIPLGGYVKIAGMRQDDEVPKAAAGRTFSSRPYWQRVVTIAAGATMNLLLAFLLFFVFYWHYVPRFEPDNTVAVVLENSGAAAAGIEPGDEILAVGGVRSDDPRELRAVLLESPDQQVEIVFRRDGETRTVPAHVGRQEDTGQGLLGVAFENRRTWTLSLPPAEAATHAARDLPEITREVFGFLGNLVHRQGLEEITSPIGIVATSTETIRLGLGIYLRMLGFISLQLAILNLLPLLPLDGGHIVMILAEKIKGSPVRREGYEKISAVGLALFFILFVIALNNDIQRLLGPGFGLQP